MPITSILPRSRLLLLPGLAWLASWLAQPVQAAASSVERDPLIQAMESELQSVAESEQMNSAGKEARIASIVRMAVVRTTKGAPDSSAVLAAAAQVADGAIRAAPTFGEAILNAVSLAPVVARIEGGAQQIRQAVRNGPPPEATTTATARQESSPAVRPAIKRQSTDGNARPAERRMARQETRPNMSQSAGSEATPYANDPELRLTLGDSVGFDLSLEVGVEHDNNIFLEATDRVADTIIRVSPGLAFQFGRAAVAGGAFSYQQSFVNYADQTAPRVSLASSSVQFGYDSGRNSFATSLAFRQLNQNDRGIESGIPSERIFRRDLFDASFGTELGLTGKIRFGTGLQFNTTSYRRDDLIDNRQFELPLKALFAMTPKTSLSVGTSYRNVKPRGVDNAPSSRDFFHNIGIRGELAPKLSGEFSLGYRTRAVANQPGDSILGFDGSLSLATSVKTSLALRLIRDFSISAQGETLESDRYTLQFAASPTDHWSLGTALSYFSSDYGPSFIAAPVAPTTVFRTDRFWEGSVMTSYAFTRWFSANADYAVRNNTSNVPTAEYANSVLKLNMRFRY